MTTSAVHLIRLARWGVTLARRRALVGIENDPNAPVALRQLVRLARLATLTGKNGPRDYAGAFRAIGPAAIKLGQSLATRPDLVGEEAANNLLSLQDSLPPVPFSQIKAAIESSFGQPIEKLFSEIDPEPVGAATRVSRPLAMVGQAATCASVGAGKLRVNHAATAGWNASSVGCTGMAGLSAATPTDE